MVKYPFSFIKHDKDIDGDFGARMVVHIPAGIVMGLLDWNNGLVRLFKFYEKNEDLHTQDEAWKDVFGAMVGWVIGRFILLGMLATAVALIVKYFK